MIDGDLVLKFENDPVDVFSSLSDALSVAETEEPLLLLNVTLSVDECEYVLLRDREAVGVGERDSLQLNVIVPLIVIEEVRDSVFE